MKLLILYSACAKLTEAHTPVTTINGVTTVWVRAETYTGGGSLMDALDAAKPMPGETVLNTVAAD